MTGRVLIVQGDALRLPLPDESVDLIITSPPFYQLRQYDAACRICEDVIASGGDPRTAFDPGWDDHVARFHHGVGLEATPQDYLDALLAATREMVRVLKPTGSLFVELGDKYANDGAGNTGKTPGLADRRYKSGEHYGRGRSTGHGIPSKSLMGLPWRYANACVDTASPYHRARFYEQLAGDLMDGDLTPDRARQLAAEFEASPKSKGLGLILRAEIIWQHVNGLPESVTDRVRAGHSRVFHFTREPRYYAALDTLREPHQYPNHHQLGKPIPRDNGRSLPPRGPSDLELHIKVNNPLGKLPGSVWAIEGGSIWDGPIRFCPRCGRDLRAAGSGSAGRTERVTVSTGSPTSANDKPTDSPTSSTSDPFPTGSPSTTSAETRDASTQPTSTLFPSASTSDEATPQPPATSPKPTASTATPSTRPTRTPGLEVNESVGCVCETVPAPAGPSSVWSVPSDPLRLPEWLGVSHYAAFPPELPRRLILGWSPPGVCVECGQGRRPVVDRGLERSERPGMVTALTNSHGHDGREGGRHSSSATILGWACSCTPYTDHPGTGEPSGPFARRADAIAASVTDNPGGGYENRPKVGPWREYHLDGWTPPPTRPAVVLDPFGGVGTTAMVARALGRDAISVDLSHAYGRAARWRCFDGGEWQQVIERTTGRKARPLPKHDPAQERLL